METLSLLLQDIGVNWGYEQRCRKASQEPLVQHGSDERFVSDSP